MSRLSLLVTTEAVEMAQLTAVYGVRVEILPGGGQIRATFIKKSDSPQSTKIFFFNFFLL